MRQALEGNLCNPTDTVCMCTYPAYLTNVTTCVSVSCTPFESLSTFPPPVSHGDCLVSKIAMNADLLAYL